ncbi:hypothetical protein [Rhizobium sp. No.120]
MKAVHIAITIAAMVCTAAESASAKDTVDLVVPQPKDYPTSDVLANMVYGRIEYSILMSAHKKSAKLSFEHFLRQAVTNAFGGEDGNYVVTLVVRNGGQEIAKKAISSFTWKNKNFLFFTVESTITSEMSFSGRLLDHFPVTNNNNSLQVSLQIQDNKTVALDTARYNMFSDQVSLMKFNLVQPAVEMSPLLKVPLQAMESLINSSDKASLSSDTTMSFIALNSSSPNRVDFAVNGPKNLGAKMNNGEKMGNGMVVTVKLETDPSLVGQIENGKFKNLDTNNVLQKATVGASAAAVPFENVLNTDANKLILSDLISLDQDKFPTGRTPGSLCRRLWDTLQKYFTERDAPAIYVAYLDKYKKVLDVSGAKAGCVDQFQTTISNLGISLSNVSITK